MFIRHRHSPGDELDFPYALGTNALSPQQAKSFRHPFDSFAVLSRSGRAPFDSFAALSPPRLRSGLRRKQGRLSLLVADESCRIFESALERVRRSYRLYVYGYVVMPEHVHLLLSEPSQQQVPFDFAQGRLSTPRIVAFAMICSGRDDRVGEI